MIFEWGLIADLIRTIILMLADAHCVVYLFQHARRRHRITPEILIKMKIGFLHIKCRKRKCNNF